MKPEPKFTMIFTHTHTPKKKKLLGSGKNVGFKFNWVSLCFKVGFPSPALFFSSSER